MSAFEVSGDAQTLPCLTARKMRRRAEREAAHNSTQEGRAYHGFACLLLVTSQEREPRILLASVREAQQQAISSLAARQLGGKKRSVACASLNPS